MQGRGVSRAGPANGGTPEPETREPAWPANAICTLDLMARGDALAHGACMHPAIRDVPRREPENELYARACDLVEAAAAIRRLAPQPAPRHGGPAGRRA